ncbi:MULTISPECIES: hypothetical protein [unclassified Streptomyces]|uniref:hypothetical protein n=1 Tax=unclassified Streptomyces TaxID=2593676 RepID=UPI003254C093
MDLSFMARTNAPGPYYGTVHITDIGPVGGGQLVVQKYLEVTLTAPVAVGNNDVQVNPTPWADTVVSTTSTDIDSQTVAVTARIGFTESFKGSAEITIGVNGDLTSQSFDETVKVTADR